MLDLIKKAEDKGFDVIIADGYLYLERVFGSKTQWQTVGELGWFYSNEDVSKFEIIKTEETSDKFFYITVKKI